MKAWLVEAGTGPDVSIVGVYMRLTVAKHAAEMEMPSMDWVQGAWTDFDGEQFTFITGGRGRGYPVATVKQITIEG